MAASSGMGWLRDRRKRKAAVRSLVVAVDRYVQQSSESSPERRQHLWRAMAAANDEAAEVFGVYPL